MALSDNSGYCEACSVHTRTLRRLYDGITFTMICENCFKARGYRVKTGSSRQDHRPVVLADPDPRLRYGCWHAHLGCSARTNHLLAVENHAKSILTQPERVERLTPARSIEGCTTTNITQICREIFLGGSGEE
ncbi:hypothetical protein PLEOSDRAFT_166720 [Pleurotus ostreatus PC15]|uniref:Uncharacterized protein n=1 Tax=Pleurotus ostreatus (strain PC15) TaxID=1137138 RepID=A0A067NU06_PLEO1|nr:hypothetical protein PLEOSDRAFT_166720 [Pleurotus ostreatus PC15]